MTLRREQRDDVSGLSCLQSHCRLVPRGRRSRTPSICTIYSNVAYVIRPLERLSTLGCIVLAKVIHGAAFPGSRMPLSPRTAPLVPSSVRWVRRGTLPSARAKSLCSSSFTRGQFVEAVGASDAQIRHVESTAAVSRALCTYCHFISNKISRSIIESSRSSSHNS